MRFLASESEGKVWAMVVANIHEEWVDPNAIKAGLMWLWNVEDFRWSEWSYDVFFKYIQFQIFFGGSGPAKTSKDTAKEMKMMKWPQPFLALRDLLMYDSSCEKKDKSCENRTCELQFLNVLELFFHAAFGNIGLFVSASTEKPWWIPSLAESRDCWKLETSEIIPSQDMFFFKNPGFESSMSAWCLSAQKNKRTQSHPGFFSSRTKQQKPHKDADDIAWKKPQSPDLSRGFLDAAAGLQKRPERPELLRIFRIWLKKNKPFGVRFFRVLRLDSAAPNRSSMAMTPEVWDELIHLREDRQKMLEMGTTVGMGESAGVLYIIQNMGCPPKIDGIPCFSGQFFFLFPL